MPTVVGPGQTALPRLVHAVGHQRLQGDVLARQRRFHRTVVGALHHEGDDVVGLADLLHHLPGAP